MMKLRILAALGLFYLLAGCGAGGTASIEGPVLDMGEIGSLVLDQFYAAEGLEDEYAPTGEFAVYIRDAITGQDMACAGQEDDMSKLGNVDTYYGGLGIGLREVTGEHPSSSARLKLVFVEKDGIDCPNRITSGDDIVGISPEFSLDDLLAGRIWASNGKAAALFRVTGTPSEEPPAMAFSMQNGLIVDQIGFQTEFGDEERRYFIFAERYVGDTSVQTCEIGEDELSNINYGGMIYAALNLPVDCFDPESADFDSIRVKISLWAQLDSGPEQIGETEIKEISELIGERTDFTNGTGFVRLRNVAIEPFGARAARLEELQRLKLTSLEYKIAASVTENIEVHMMSPDGYSVVCTGTDQGLVNVASTNTLYDGLSATFVAVDKQRELFGWDELDFVVVGRSDGQKCPASLESDYTVLGISRGLEPYEIKSGTFSFEDGGSATASYTP